VAKLRKLADAMAAELAGNQPSARRPAGEVDKPQLLYPAAASPPRAKKPKAKAAGGK
jgi:hypothetical protein